MPEKIHKEEIGLRYLSEIAAILIAAIVMIGFIILMRETYSHVGPGKENEFHQTKELLQIFTGFLGIVIGYYFNRVSTETRAEKAESAARTANEKVQGAIEGHQNALHESSAAKETAHIVKSELRNLANAAKKLLENSGNQQTRGNAVINSGLENELNKLQEAIERSERLL